MSLPSRYGTRRTSHPGIDHEDLSQFGYDWSQIGDPQPVARPPLKIYLPQTTQDVIAAVQETRALGQTLVVRGSAHSSNDLVTPDRGVVLSTVRLRRILSIDETALTVTVQAGAITADVDEELARRGLGLPVLGDHNDITVGGFASAGGIGPASHRVGLLVDNVAGLEYVDFEGRLHACSRDSNPEELDRVLAGTGQHGVIVTFVLSILRIDKERMLLENERNRFLRVESFLERSARQMADPEIFMQRGFWADLPFLGRSVAFGRFYAYRETPRNPLKALMDRIAYGYLHLLGRDAGHLPGAWLETVWKLLGFVGMSNSPKYGTVRNVESFTDRIMASTVGDPTRWFIALPPLDTYPDLFRALYQLTLDYRREHGCFNLVSLYVKGIRSRYLSQGRRNDRFCELTLFLSSPAGLPGPLLERFVSGIDDLCIKHRAFRYMHTRTIKDPARRRLIDPNAFYAEQSQKRAEPRAGLAAPVA